MFIGVFYNFRPKLAAQHEVKTEHRMLTPFFFHRLLVQPSRKLNTPPRWPRKTDAGSLRFSAAHVHVLLRISCMSPFSAPRL